MLFKIILYLFIYFIADDLNSLFKKLEYQNITVIMAHPHTHLTGIELWTQIIRNGDDIGYLFRNKYYNFNYQNSYLLDPPVNLTKVNKI